MENKGPAWDDLRVLLEVYRRRSFLGAGKELGLSTSTVARRIATLEAQLGRPLVHRSTAGTSLESEALPLVALAQQLEQGLATARRDESASGTVRISLGSGFARPVTRLIAEVRRAHPRLQIELVAEARPADLARREADLAVRTLRSASRGLIEKRVGMLRFGLFAAQEYIERRLRDAVLRRADFAQQDFIGYEGELRKLPQERWLIAEGAVCFPFRSNSQEAIAEAALAGQGIAMLAEEAAEGLQRVTPEGTPALPATEVFLVMREDLRKVPRIQTVARALEAGIRARLR